ncbi:MAG: PDZ domain-containing protein [Bacteroidales bacterium]|jgi:Do/DeqQ family serine protease|nr:PDZ domain-containing protein [Bacteroidales bacterium]
MKKFWNFIGIVVLATAISFGVTYYMVGRQNSQADPQLVSYSGSQPVNFASHNRSESTTGVVPVDFTKAAEMSVGAVVHVKTKYNIYGKQYVDPFYQFFFGRPQQQQPMQQAQATGSGVILSDDGYIVTNNHVIAQANEIEVVLNDKRSFTAQLIGTDPNTDIALLKIDATGLPTLEMGNSDDLKVGEWVLAVGNPFNLTSTVTAGIVSAKARNINILDADMKIESFIQTDAAVNPGNSGGALVNTRGELVGINTAIASQTGSYAGYAFAVPTSIVQKVVADLRQYGSVQRALLGIRMLDITSEVQQYYHLNTLEGVYIAEVVSGSAAEKGGVLAGDVVVAVNGTTINSSSELQEKIARKNPGDEVTLTVLRDGKRLDLRVTLASATKKPQSSTPL